METHQLEGKLKALKLSGMLATSRRAPHPGARR